MKCFLWAMVGLLWGQALCVGVLAQVPTEVAKDLFKELVADFVLKEIEVKRYCVLIRMTDASSTGDGPEKIQTSEGFLAVDKEKKRVRYDFFGESCDENGVEEVVALRHLELDKKFYWGEKSGPEYRVTRQDMNRLLFGKGRLFNPMLLPLGGGFASKSPSLSEKVIDLDFIEPEEIAAGWYVGEKVTGSLNKKFGGSREIVFERPSGVISESRFYLHPASLFVDVPSSKYRAAIVSKTKWKELPRLGWRPIQSEDSSLQGPSERRLRTSVTTHLTWLTDDFPDRVFEPIDLEHPLDVATSLQKCFK